MFSRAICVALAALVVFQCVTAYDPIALKNHCFNIVTYTSGPGGLDDYLNRWAFYFADRGNFKSQKVTYRTKREWKDAAVFELSDYDTYNHVHLVDEIVVSDDTCYIDAYFSFLAWDGACGPLIFKTKFELTFTPGVDAGRDGKIKEFKSVLPTLDILAATDSCTVQKQKENGIKNPGRPGNSESSRTMTRGK